MHGLGIFLITWGNHLASQDGTYSSAPWSFWGVVFILMPLWAGIGWVVTEVVKFSARQHRRYRQWKASLTPQQRAAVDLAEAAAMTAAAVAMREHHKRTNARLPQQRHGTHHARWPHDATIGQAHVLPPAVGGAPPCPVASMGSAGRDGGQPGGDREEPPRTSWTP